MPSTPRTAVLVGVAMRTLGTLAHGASGPSAGSLFRYPERVTLRDGGLLKAERGMLFVPVRRGDPESRTIGVEFYRFFGTSAEAASRPPVFQLRGGPGFPGLERAIEKPGSFEEGLGNMVALADVVVVGQRGIGSSKPDTRCEAPASVPMDAADRGEQEARALGEAAARCRAFWELEGYDLSGFNVVEAAADVADVARALGYGKIQISGGSFGSHWGMAVMRYHPEIVERAVLTGMEGPDHTYDMPSGVLASLTRIAAAADAAPELADLVPEGGLLAAFQEVVASAEKEPIRVEVEGPDGEAMTVLFSGDDVRGMATGVTASTGSRRRMKGWPADVLRLHAGDYKAAAQEALEDRASLSMPTASAFMLDCGSGMSAPRRKTFDADPARAVVGHTGWFYDAACPHWGADLGEDFREGFDTMIPTVIVHGTWDTSTPYDNALELVPRFKNSHFVTVEGGSHGALREALQDLPEFREGLGSPAGPVLAAPPPPARQRSGCRHVRRPTVLNGIRSRSSSGSCQTLSPISSGEASQNTTSQVSEARKSA
jgi:pimeloyl-ACP methyl ester carboxylesterase